MCRRQDFMTKKMERKTRLELATPTLARWCSTTELFPHLEATFRIELKIEDLQSSALPLGYVAGNQMQRCIPI